MTEFAIPIYPCDFFEAVEEVARQVEFAACEESHFSIDLDQFADCIKLKFPFRAPAHSNAIYRNFFKSGDGISVADFFDPTTHRVSVKSDELLLGGAKSVGFEHVSIGPDGNSYHVRVHKRLLPENLRGWAILEVARVLSKIDVATPHLMSLATCANRYQALGNENLNLCRLLAAGHSQREIAVQLGCTPRTIENRRKCIQQNLGVEKPIEIVKLMVRLAEHGLIKADF